jgi:hypothetical protein
MKRECDFSKARRGPLVPADPHKTRVTIWLDTSLVDYLGSIVDRAGGGSYEDLINELLRERVFSHGGDAPGVKVRSPKVSAGRDKIIAALKILDSGEARGIQSGGRASLSDSTTREVRSVQRNKKTHGGKAVRLLDFDT